MKTNKQDLKDKGYEWACSAKHTQEEKKEKIAASLEFLASLDDEESMANTLTKLAQEVREI